MSSLHHRPCAVALALIATLLVGLSLALPVTSTSAQGAPALAYGTFLGGASDDVATAVATDAQGNIYIAGYTYSNPFPGTAGQDPYTNAFVIKLDPTGTQVIYSTLMGGSNDEEGLALAVDAQGNAWVTGFTESDDLPTINPITDSITGERDTFLTKLAPNGDVYFQTYLGTTASDQANAIALDKDGNAYLAGWADWDFGPAAMVKKVKADGSAQVYQAFFGKGTRGFDVGTRLHGIAVDSQGNAVVVGETNAPVLSCIGLSGGECPSRDAFVLVLNAAGDNSIADQSLGGMGNDAATGVALDKDGNIYITGTTFSDDFPTKNAWQAQKRGTSSFADAFLLKLNPLAAGMVYGTYYGGDDYEEAYGVAVDSAGGAYLTGLTSSGNLPVPSAAQPAITGQCITGATRRLCYDAFVAAFDVAGRLSWGSYHGGTDDDLGKGVAVGPGGDLYLVGRADSFTVPVTEGALQPKRHGFDEAFLAHFRTGSAQPAPGSHRVYVPQIIR